MRTASKRARPGSKGTGRFFHVQVRPAAGFVRFRVQDIGARGGLERVSGQRRDGSWDTVKWLLEKTHAHLRGGRLVADTAEARKLLRGLGSTPLQTRGDRFRARPRTTIPEADKPTARQLRAWRRNIRIAQQVQRKTR